MPSIATVRTGEADEALARLADDGDPRPVRRLLADRTRRHGGDTPGHHPPALQRAFC